MAGGIVALGNAQVKVNADNELVVSVEGGVDPTGPLTLTNPSVGTPLLDLGTTATGDDPAALFFQAKVDTTDGNATILKNWSNAGLISNGRYTVSFAATIVGVITGHRTGGTAGSADDSAGYQFSVCLKYDAGGEPAEVAAETLAVIGESQGGWTVTGTASSESYRVLVTGATDNNVSWTGSFWVYLAKG